MSFDLNCDMESHKICGDSRRSNRNEESNNPSDTIPVYAAALNQTAEYNLSKLRKRTP